MKKGRTGLGLANDFLVNLRLPQREGGKVSRKSKDAPLTGPYLMDYCRAMDRLEKLFVQALPADMRQEFKLANYKDGELVVFCSQASYASHLKYHSEEIMEILRNLPEFHNLIKIKIQREEI